MIESLTDVEMFRQRSRTAWARNRDYWLTGSLRHVTDVGDFIVARVRALCQGSGVSPVLVDMGCGSAWLLNALDGSNIQYVGIDNNPAFIDFGSRGHAGLGKARFILADLDTQVDVPAKADLVVNAFNFLELSNLDQAMGNVERWLQPDGKLFMSTIDKTYLILALSKDWDDFQENLRRYQELPGLKYGFQNIDFGAAVSDTLEYPSVLYSAQDYINAARAHGLCLVDYVEHPFTSTTVPKIYCHFEFRNAGNTSLSNRGFRDVSA